MRNLSHHSADFLSLEEIAGKLNSIRERISADPNYSQDEKRELLEILTELSSFELGRFVIQNNGAISGWWTYYLTTAYKKQNIENALERFIVTQAPIVLATQERFAIFQDLLLQNIQSNQLVCSVPCGVMADLSTLQISPQITNLKFVGVDVDDKVFQLAKQVLSEQTVSSEIEYEFHQKDAWQLGFEKQFDIIVSNGLNVYEKNDLKVVDLYTQFFNALKPNGILICSALAYPPSVSVEKTEWNLGNLRMSGCVLTQVRCSFADH